MRAEYLDFSMLDIETHQHSNRNLAAAFFYLTFILGLRVHSP